MTEQDKQTLRQGLERLGVTYPPQAVEQLALYCTRLLEKNQVMNLTAITDPAEVVTRHFLDSAALLPTRALSGRRVIDVGTGGGFPGLVLRLLDPTIRLTLLDSLGKRIDWLSCARSWTCPTWCCTRAGRRSFPGARSTGSSMTWQSPGPWPPWPCWPSCACPTSSPAGSFWP